MPSSEAPPFDDVHPALRDVPILDFLPREVRRLVEYSFTPMAFPFGTAIVKEGDPSDAMFVLVSGRARVVKRTDGGGEVPLNMIGPGEMFGEVGLLGGTPRSATVRASSDVEALRLDGSIFFGLVRSHPVLKEALELQARRHLLRSFLRTYPAFSDLPAAGMQSLLRELEPMQVGAGTMVIREGEPAGPMFLVEEGRLRVFRARDAGRGNLRFLRRGDVFGESSLFTGRPRVASIEAVTDCSLLMMQRATFDRLFSSQSAFRIAIERRATESLDFRVARIPLDFAEEILPADPGPGRPVGPEQVETTIEAGDAAEWIPRPCLTA